VIARIAYPDIASFFHDDGTIKKPSELDEDQRASLAAFEACITNVEAGDGHQDFIHRFRSWDKTRALEMLAKHFGLFDEKVKHSGEIRIRWQTDEEPSCEMKENPSSPDAENDKL
jgi:phage terminase small subunit